MAALKTVLSQAWSIVPLNCLNMVPACLHSNMVCLAIVDEDKLSTWVSCLSTIPFCLGKDSKVYM